MGENGQSFNWVAKPIWDQTVGSSCEVKVQLGSLSTGSPVGSAEISSTAGLNVQSGHHNPHFHRGEWCLCDQVD